MNLALKMSFQLFTSYRFPGWKLTFRLQIITVQVVYEPRLQSSSANKNDTLQTNVVIWYTNYGSVDYSRTIKLLHFKQRVCLPTTFPLPLSQPA